MQNSPSPDTILEYVNDVLGFRFKYSKYPFAADSWEVETAHIVETWSTTTVIALVRAELRNKPRWSVIGVSFGTQPAKPSVTPVGKVRPSRPAALAIAERQLRKNYNSLGKPTIVTEMAERVLKKDEYAEFTLLIDDGVR